MVFRITVARPLSAGRIVMSLLHLSYWIATNSPLLILLEGGLDFFRHFTTSPLRLCALDVGRNLQAISVLTITSLVGSTLRDTAKFKPFSSMPAIYSEILPVSVTLDRSRQTSGHPALTIGAVASSSLTKET